MYAVLYVDDEPDLLDLAQVYLEDTGIFLLDKTDSASGAQEKLKKQRYDAIIADYQMPGMDGIQFLKYIREHFGNVPFILFTGKGREEVVIEAINNGADYYLQKGGDPDSLFAELIHKLRQAIQLRKDQATLRINEERLRRAQEIGHTGTWEYTIANQKIWGSDEGFRIFGIDSPAGEIPVGQIEACIRSEQISRRTLHDLIYGGKDYDIVYTINPANGSLPRIIRSIAKLETDDEGKPVKVLGIIQDITEQTGVQSALVESEKKYRNLVEHSLQGVAISRGTTVLYANSALLAMYGYDSFEEFEKIPVFNHLTPEYRKLADDRMKKYSGGQAPEKELVQDIIRKDGAIRTLAFNISPIEFNGERCEQLTFIDITERKQAEEALRESEVRYRNIYESAPVGIFRCTPAGKFIHVNPALARMFGYESPREFILEVNTSSIPDLLWEDPSLRPAFIRKVMDSPGWHYSDNRYRRRDGRIITIHLSYRSSINPDTGLAELKGFAEDVTKRANAANALKESEERFRTLIEMAPTAIRISRNGRILYANARYVQMFGYMKPDEIHGQVTLKDFAPQERAGIAERVHAGHTDPGTAEEFETRGLRQDGSEFPVIVVTKKVQLADGEASLEFLTDFTERRLAQEALIKSEHRFRDIYENAPVGIFRSTMEGKFIHANPALAQMLGYDSAEELIGRVNEAGIPAVMWEDATHRPDFVKEVIDMKGWHRSEHRFRHKYNQTIIVSLLYRAIVNHITGETELEGFCVDITDHKKAVEALMESEKRFADVTKNAGEWIWEVDADGIFTYSSPVGENIHGYTADELVGKLHFYDLFVPEVKEELKQNTLDAFRQKTAFRNFINSNIHKNGSIVILDTSGTPMLDADGTLLGYRGTDLDITSRKKTEEELQKNEARFRQLVNQLQDSVVILSSDGTILFCNPSAFVLVGLPPGEIIPDNNISQFIDRDSLGQVMDNLKDIASGKPIRISEYRIRAADDRPRWVEASGTRITYLGRNAVMVAIRDVTERKRAQEELETINKKLELLSSITRHDIINKITVILGNVRAAKKKRIDPEIAGLLDKLESAAKSIRDQTEFTRIYQILGSHEPQWQDLKEIIPTTIVPPEIRFETAIGEIEILADPMLEKVFYNLLDNSIKHGNQVSQIRLYSEPAPEGLTIVWEDNGAGIPAGDKEYIFERGFGSDSGLGLFLCREILAITGIGIRETGTFGNGARFEIVIPADHFRLPVKKGADDRIPG